MTWFKVVFISISLLAGALAGGGPVFADQSGQYPDWGPYVTQLTETSAVLHWRTAGITSGVIEYLPENGGSAVYHYDGAKEFHHVGLSNLMPDTGYRYRLWMLEGPHEEIEGILQEDVSEAGVWLENNARPAPECRFRTLGAETFTFIVYGDSQEQAPWFTQLERHKLVADRIAAEPDAAFVVHLGDFVYEPSEQDEWDRCFQAARSMLASTALFTVRGNHETVTAVYKEMFDYDGYYSIDAGPVHIAVLDTNTWADIAAQTSWLADDLADAGKWKFVFYHHPSYTSQERNYGGWEHSREAWEQVFLDTGVTAVFSGHVHAYERYLEHGLTYFTVGTGGDVLTALEETKYPGFQNGLERNLGYARVTVSGDTASVEFVQVAEISPDNRTIIRAFPPDQVYETVSLSISSPRALVPSGNFVVTPASLELRVTDDGSTSFTMSVISTDAGELLVGTENLSFIVEPSRAVLDGSQEPKKIALHLFGDDDLEEGTYHGKLTLIKKTGENVAIGVKVPLTVTQTGGHEKGFFDTLLENIWLLAIAVVVVGACIWLFIRYRQYRR